MVVVRGCQIQKPYEPFLGVRCHRPVSEVGGGFVDFADFESRFMCTSVHFSLGAS